MVLSSHCGCLRRARPPESDSDATFDAVDETHNPNPISITEDTSPDDDETLPSPTITSLSPGPPCDPAVTDDADGVAEAQLAERSDAASVTTNASDEKEAEEDTTVAGDDERRPPSSRLRWDTERGVSVFEGIEQGAFHANISDLSIVPTPDEYTYDDGYEIVDDGKSVGTIVKFLGQGAMGTVHRFLPSGEGAVPCAAKTVRADVSAKARVEMEKQLAVEVSISFALGRHKLIASVVRMVVPLPGVATTAKGLLLLCELVDGGDLEEAMSTKAAVRRMQPDYAGTLWDVPSAAMWPLASITLQIFLGFAHVHSRAIIHQARERNIVVVVVAVRVRPGVMRACVRLG